MILGPDKRSRLDRRVGALKSDRQSWEPHFRELETHFAPRRGRWTTSDHNRNKASANSAIINGTPLYAVRVLKSGMMSGHTSPSRPWFRLITPDPALMEVAGVRDWLYQVEQRMREVFARSNIYNALPTCYGDLATYGTCALGIYPDERDTIRAYPYLTGSYWIANSARLSGDTFFREWRESLANVVEEYGLDSLPDALKESFEKGHYDVPVDICHLIQPNLDRNPRYADSRNMQYESIHWIKGWPEEKALRVSGHPEMPVLIGRWETAGENAWGDSLGMDALGDAKQLQFEERRYAQMLDKLAQPAYIASPDLKNSQKDTNPGGFTYSALGSSQSGMTPLYVPNPTALQFVRETIRGLEERVSRTFYVDVFLMLAQSDRRQVTAREVEERHTEKLMMLGPILERLSDEILDPLIDRTFRIMDRAGLIPDWPPELDNAKLKIEYISILAQAQKAVGRGAIEGVVNFAGALAALNPEAIDKVDMDQSIDEYSTLVGAPPTIIRSDDAVAALRNERAKQQQMAQAAALAQQSSQTAKNLGQTPMGESNALEEIVGS